MRRLLLLAAIGTLAVSAGRAGLNLGMPAAVKSKAGDLDAKIKNARQALIGGTAASGHPLASQTVTIGDCSGSTRTGTTAADGSFSILTGLSFPIFLKVGANPSYYSVAYGAGTVDIDPVTDLILRSYYRSSRGITNLDNSFNGNFTPLCGPPPPAAVSAFTSLMMNALSPVAARNGVSPVAFDPFTSGFSADGTGFDAVLDQTRIAANADYSTVMITDVNTAVVLSTITPALNDASAPAAPSGLTATSVASTTVTLQWTASASTNTAGYGISRGGVLIAQVPGTSYADANLAAGTQYGYTVDAFNWKNTRSAATPILQARTFVPLTVSRAGPGSGTVSSAPSGIVCGGVCSTGYAVGTQVALTAAANAGSSFAGWSGGCSGTGACVVTMSAGQSVTAAFSPLNILTVSFAGTGGGSVASSPAGINCVSACSAGYAANTLVALTATPAGGSAFAGWSGAGCSGAGACVVTMGAAAAVAATFNAASANLLTVQFIGPGGITDTESGTTCVSNCTELVAANGIVQLTAAGAGSVFSGFSGAGCSSAYLPTTCLIYPMNSSQTVTATFIPQFALTVTENGTGGGSVTSSPAGISCGAACSASYAPNTPVTLTATAGVGSAFAGWSGSCSGTGACVVTMSAAKAVAATFNAAPGNTLTVQFGGTGGGSITDIDSSKNCASNCTELVAANGSVNLTAAASAGSVFTGFTGGGCSASYLPAACVIDPMSAAQTVTATFASAYTLTVAENGTGGGSVTGSPVGISCGASCAAPYASNTSVTLTTAANVGSAFAGWGGACSGTGVCVVTMSAAQSVTATFNLLNTLTVSLTGTGSGSVTSSPAGINCAGACAAVYAANTPVTLTAAPSAGSTFAGWSGGGCSGTGGCVVTMSAAQSVTARFDPASGLDTLYVGIQEGAGTVTSSPPGINCTYDASTGYSGACSASFAQGGNVTLTAAPGSGLQFEHWNCAGSAGNPATITLPSSQTPAACYVYFIPQ